MKPSFALYRQPLSEVYTEVIPSSDDPIVLRSVAEIGHHRGFVVAPFSADEHCPIVVLKNDRRTLCIPTRYNGASVDAQRNVRYRATERPLESNEYSVVFQRFHDEISGGRFRKIVLARQTSVEMPRCDDEEEFLSRAKSLFFRACHLYPRMFVALVSTPLTGTWLTATPEILLAGNQGRWHTMALAGTMKLTPEQMDFDTPPTGRRTSASDICWSDKNIGEQRFVASYINDCLQRFASKITEDGPYTSRAGNLVHLRSDFSFRLDSDADIGPLLDALHPTPAVCGLPKDDARQFIIAGEDKPRRYYSGFMGEIDPQGETNLYVTLRCMELNIDRATLYAGGGLMPESCVEREWEETEAKMQTMRRVISDDNV